MKIPRKSQYGFYCANCNKFVYSGFDKRDKVDLPNDNAVCMECGKYFLDKEEDK